MKKILFLLMILTGCGQEQVIRVYNSPTKPEVNFAGYYVLPDGGYLDIYRDAQGAFNIRSARLMVRNADGSLALLPVTTINQMLPVNGVIYQNLNVTFVAATNNVKNDINWGFIVGVSLLSLSIELVGETGFKIEIFISQGPTLLYNHVIE